MPEEEKGYRNEDDGYFVPFTKSEWSFADLMGSKVEFRWSYQGVEAKGEGTFLVRHAPEDCLAIEITVLLSGDRCDPWKDRHHALHQRHVDAIELHPEAGQGTPPKPKFRMLA